MYLYGYGRVGEYTGDWSYYATDALGSVRQIVDQTGMVQYYQSYEPYGDVLASAGQGGSNYGYAAEWTDATGLQYLRARYYNTGVGRFLTRDTWAGEYKNPLSLNRWAYVQGNPVRYADPSGMVVCDSSDPLEYETCKSEYIDQIKQLQSLYHEQLRELIARSNTNDEVGPESWRATGDARERGNVTTPPPGISWNPSLTAWDSKDVLDHQYDIDTNGDGVADADYGFMMCGQISSDIVLKELTGINFLHDLYQAGKDLYCNLIDYWAHGNSTRWKVDENANVVGVPEASGRIYDYDKPGYIQWISDTLSKSRYFIGLVEIDTSNQGILTESGTEHWVVFDGISIQWDYSNMWSEKNWIRIVNPFYNRKEYYWWPEFRLSVHTGPGLEVSHGTMALGVP